MGTGHGRGPLKTQIGRARLTEFASLQLIYFAACPGHRHAALAVGRKFQSVTYFASRLQIEQIQ